MGMRMVRYLDDAYSTVGLTSQVAASKLYSMPMLFSRPRMQLSVFPKSFAAFQPLQARSLERCCSSGTIAQWISF